MKCHCKEYTETLCSVCGAPVCDECAGGDSDARCPDCWEDEGYCEDMDGDHESALASAGWGTDEDYGCYGGEEGW